MLFNTDVALWANYRKSLDKTMPNGGPTMSVHDGHIGNGYEVLARFQDNKAAVKCLVAAGWRKVARNQFRAR